MVDFMFYDTASVHIQGDQVLKYRFRYDDHAEYGLIGFQHIVTIRDYRSAGLRAIDDFLANNKAENFPKEFNTPSLVKMKVVTAQNILIELFDTDVHNPIFMLWLASGIKNKIPVFRYLYKRVQAMDNNRFAFLSLYQRSLSREAYPEIKVKTGMSALDYSSLAGPCESCT